ncbi:MAG TPA: sigma-70 family RNA polymerase sigma factor [Actinophytocola sp.]|nr:sigma-70 family RNA polymerase sigma factor [Actinophytocola sp.]
MNVDEALIGRFEAEREHLRGVAFRILGSLEDAEDAVQQTWLKVSQTELRGVQNLTGWLTTVTARECLDALRARKRRGEVALPDDKAIAEGASVPQAVEDEVVLAESVGRALLVVLDRLTPTERVALVLHDMFAVPFDEVGDIVDRSPVAAKKLASRARQKVQGDTTQPRARLGQQRRLAQAFLSAARGGDVHGLLAVLAPDVIRRAEAAALPVGTPTEIRGIDAVVEETMAIGRRAAVAELALIDGTVGIVVAPRGRLLLALVLTFGDGRISAYDVIATPARLDQLAITLLDDGPSASFSAPGRDR